MKLTRNFSASEFCVYGYPSTYHALLMAEALEAIRWALGGKPITITSGYRTPGHNQQVGGAKSSQHVVGTAVDFQVQGVDAETVGDWVVEGIKSGVIPAGGVGIYKNHVHYDLRGKLVVWRSEKD